MADRAARLAELARAAALVAGGPLAFIGVLEGDELRLEAQAGLTDRVMPALPQALLDVLRAGAPLVIADLAEDPRTAGHALRLDGRPLAMLAAFPVLAEGVIGTLAVASPTAATLTPAQGEVLAILARQVARWLAATAAPDAGRFLDSIVESIPDMIFVKEADSLRFVRFNRAGEELLGLKRADLIGKSDQDFFPPEQAAAFVAKDREVLAGGVVVRIPEEPLDTADKGTRYLDTKKIPLLDADGRPAFLLGISRDITEFKALTEELRRTKQEAETANLAKSAFLASMSHELRTPLNAIIGFSELLEQEAVGPLVPRQRKYVENVLSGGRHLLQLVNDILDLSKVEAGRLDLALEWHALATIVEAVRTNLQPLAAKREVRLEAELPSDLPELLVDSGRIRQIVYNLVSNGLKFTPAGGLVRVSARTVDHHFEIAVSDTGAGIAAADLPRLFREFEQIHPSASKPEGTGLGLAITKRLVELHAGTIDVVSQPGLGSTFTVRLPLLRRSGGPHTHGDTGPAESLVLVVDDDAIAAELVAGHLRAAGLSVAFARNASHAVTMAAELSPVAITLDIVLPGVDGWGILAELKRARATAGIPVIIVSVVDEHSRGLALGADGYLVKPVTGEALRGALTAVGVKL